MMELTIELVPKTSFYNNVRTNVTKEEWDVIRKRCYELSDYRCEICSDNGINQGYEHPVECHEIWEYDDDKNMQILMGFISLCPLCHKVKHSGLAQINDELDLVIEQLMRVNRINQTEANKYIDQAFRIWEDRSEKQWKLDISYVKTFLNFGI